jgi:hypothetical protein
MNKPNLSTAEKLEVILADIDDAVLIENLRNTFFLVDPLQYARLLSTCETISDSAKGKLLALKVSQPPAYQGVDLQPLLERSMNALWTRLAEDAKV